MNHQPIKKPIPTITNAKPIEMANSVHVMSPTHDELGRKIGIGCIIMSGTSLSYAARKQIPARDVKLDDNPTSPTTSPLGLMRTTAWAAAE